LKSDLEALMELVLKTLPVSLFDLPALKLRTSWEMRPEVVLGLQVGSQEKRRSEPHMELGRKQ